MKIKYLIIFLSSLSNQVFSQRPILVTESTIILDYDQSKEIFFSFAEGDEIIFNMEMVKGKHIKEVEVIEVPTNTILTEFKVSDIKDKRLQVRNKGIYKFRFYSSSLTRRICKIKIHRIPANESPKSFNTNWKWKVVKDSIYVRYQKDSLIGYNTVKYQETIRELKETKLEEIMLFEKSQKVHSYYNENKSKTYLKVDLPLLNNAELKEESLIAWSYWIGVGQEGQDAYKENLKSVSSLVGEASSIYFQNPLTKLAVGEISKLVIPQTGEDVEYYFINNFKNVQQFLNGEEFYLFDKGKGRAAFGRNDKIKEGVFYIGLSNDNMTMGIEVEVKVLVVKEVKLYKNTIYDREKQVAQYVTLDKTRLEIKETRFRVPVE